MRFFQFDPQTFQPLAAHFQPLVLCGHRIRLLAKFGFARLPFLLPSRLITGDGFSAGREFFLDHLAMLRHDGLLPRQ